MSCRSCQKEFKIDVEDTAFYEQMQVPPPTLCPECRLIRRMTFRNERTLYKRKCDLCHEDKIFMYPTDAPFPVYCHDCWYGISPAGEWNPKSYGRDYDFNQPFFEQFLELRNAVPRCGVVKQKNSINSEYTNRVTDMRNCYLVFGTTIAEDCRYGAWLNESKDCQDCYSTQKSQRCYECIDVFKCYQLTYSQECNECIDSSYLYNCRNCTNCLGCVNLRHKSFCIYNEQYSRENYFAEISKIKFQISKFEDLKKTLPMPAFIEHKTTNATGNWIENSKNVFHSFNMLEVEDGRYCFNLIYAKDVMDYGPWANHSERIYECINVGIQCANVKFSNECWEQLIDSEYCFNCRGSKNLFACNGLHRAEYCILNKQYTPDEYLALKSKIKSQMSKMGEYGEFFPMELSPHAYNETIAQEFFPLTKEQALAKGYRWRDPEPKNYAIGGDIIACEHAGPPAGGCAQQCTTAFRITDEDTAFYEIMKVKPPKLCPNCRHFERLAKRTPLNLWKRQCAKCNKEIETSYAPDRSETVYCVECYSSSVS